MKDKSTIFFYASLASIVISIVIYTGDNSLSKLNGIFVGLWAPTLMALVTQRGLGHSAQFPPVLTA